MGRSTRPWLRQPNALRFEDSVRRFLDAVGSDLDYAGLAELPSPETRRYVKTLNWLETHRPPAREDQPPRVCDLGGYFGMIADAVRGLGYEVDLLDDYSRITSGDMVALEDWWEAAGVTAHHCDLQDPGLKLPFADSSFDFVILSAVIEHFASSPRLVLQEARRVLRPGGDLILDTPHAGALGVRIGFLLHGEGLWSNIDDLYPSEIPFWGHKRCYSRRELQLILQKEGYELAAVDLFELAGRDHDRSWRGRLLYDGLAPLLFRVAPDLHNCIWIAARRP